MGRHEGGPNNRWISTTQGGRICRYNTKRPMKFTGRYKAEKYQPMAEPASGFTVFMHG